PPAGCAAATPAPRAGCRTSAPRRAQARWSSQRLGPFRRGSQPRRVRQENVEGVEGRPAASGRPEGGDEAREVPDAAAVERLEVDLRKPSATGRHGTGAGAEVAP